MDYLYINAIVKEVYKDLPCGCPFPAEYSKTMYGTVSGFDCLSNPDIQDVLSFFTVRAKGQPTAMIFSRIQKHTNSASVGRFIQSIGWTWDGDLLFRNLDSMLNVGFYTENEINDTALRGGSFPLPRDRSSSYEEIPIALTPKVKQAILTTVLLRWLRFEAPLRIAVPKNVDYNSYVLSAAKTIYKLLPASLRARAGFCSYLPSDKNLPETIFIGFIPEEMADSRTLYLDGSSPAACNLLNCGTNSTPMDTFIAYIANAPDSELQSFFEELYEDMEGSGDNEKMVQVAPRDYQNIGTALGLLTLDGELTDLKREWDKRFFENIDKFSPRMQQRIRERIRATVNPAEFCKLAQRRLSTEGFQGLRAYRDYCIDNPILTESLWNTALVQQVERKKTYTEIYNSVSKRNLDLDFILDDAKLNALFSQSVQEQLQDLQAISTNTLTEVQKLSAKAKDLVIYSQSRPIPAALAANVQSFCDQLQNQEKQLILEGLTAAFQRYQSAPLSNDIGEISSRMDDLAQFRAKAVSLASIPGVDKVLASIDDFISILKNHKDDLVYQNFLARFSEIQDRPSKTAEQISAAINSIRDLLAKLELAPQTANFLALQQDMNRFVSEKEAEINSSNVKFLKINQILENPGLDYFQILEALNNADKRQLEDQHHQIINTKLAQLRCRNLAQYEEEFRRYYRKPLTLSSMAALPNYVFIHISQDICQMKQFTVNCSRNCKATETAKRLTGIMAVLAKVSGEHTLEVSYDGSKLNSTWFLDLLQLNLDKNTLLDSQKTEDVFYSLVNANAFRGSELLASVEMIQRCELSYGKLFVAILQGCFTDATEYQYRQAFEMIVRGSKNPNEALQKMSALEQQMRDKDPKAAKAFRDVLRAQQQTSSQKPRKGLIAAIVALSVLVVALIAVVVLTNLPEKDSPDDTTVSDVTEAPTEPTPTEPTVVCPEEFLFFSENAASISLLYGNGSVADFSEHSDSVITLLDMVDDEAAAAILELYNQYKGTDVTISNDSTVAKWEEYLFWVLRYNADADPAQLLSMLQETTSDEMALSVLRVIYHGLPDEEIVSEEIATESANPDTTDGETADDSAAEETNTAENPTDPAVDGTEASESDTTEETPEVEVPDATEATENPEVIAATEPPATLSDVKSAIVDAAAETYEASQSYASRLALIQNLFGSDFTKSFSAHADLVSGLDALGDAESESYAHLLKHYQIMPGDTAIKFNDIGTEITWDEFVFWECWILVQQGVKIVDEQTFNTDLYAQVADVLTVIHQLVSEEDYTLDLPATESDSPLYQGEYEIAPVLLNIIHAAEESFETEQSTYAAIFMQVSEQNSDH